MTQTVLGSLKDFATRPMIQVTAGGKRILVINQGFQFFAIDDTCTHQGCSLSAGVYEGETVRCACHGSVFRVRTGEVVRGPALKPEISYPVTFDNGNLFVDM